MKKAIAGMLLLVSLAVGVIGGVRIFFPWEKAMELAFLKGARIVTSLGLDMGARDFSVDGLIPSFRAGEVKIVSFMGQINIKKVSLTPLLWKSLSGLAPGASLVLDGGTLSLGGGAGSFSGSVTFRLKGGVIFVEDCRIEGDLSAEGGFVYSPKKGRILKARMSIRVPAEMDGTLALASSMAPLKKQGDGSWILEREEGK